MSALARCFLRGSAAAVSSCASATEWSMALGLVAKELPGRARAQCIFRLLGPLLGQECKNKNCREREHREEGGRARRGEPGARGAHRAAEELPLSNRRCVSASLCSASESLSLSVPISCGAKHTAAATAGLRALCLFHRRPECEVTRFNVSRNVSDPAPEALSH